MPRFLLITILMLVTLGQIFAVSDFSSASPSVETVVQENINEPMIIENTKDEKGKDIEIIQWPLANDDTVNEKIPVPINDGKDCLYFDQDITRIELCDI